MLRRTIRVLVALTALGLATARADEPFPDGQKTFERTRELILREHADDKLSEEQLWKAATAGLLSGGGKWDKLMSPGEVAELMADLRGEVVGLGILMSSESHDELVNIEGVVPGSAAARAGVLPGDRILRADGKPLKGPDAMAVARALRGRAGTTVTLTLLRDAQVVTKTIKRAPFVFEPVTEQMLPGAIALVQIRNFSEKTPGLLKTVLDKARGDGAKALVLDLRDNPGGLFEAMLKCADELLPRGTLVVTALHRGGQLKEHRTGADPVVTLPMAALVDGRTASSAEMLAAAMQSTGARVIGKRTLGKWNAQAIQELGNGWAAKLTTAWFRAPSGQMLDGKGLDPDVEVELDAATASKAAVAKDAGGRVALDPQLRAAVNLLKLSTR